MHCLHSVGCRQSGYFSFSVTLHRFLFGLVYLDAYIIHVCLCMDDHGRGCSRHIQLTDIFWPRHLL